MSCLGVAGASADEVFAEVSVTEVTPERQLLPQGDWSYAQCVDYAVANNPDIR